jgi:anti-anti-sigma regulatory factor
MAQDWTLFEPADRMSIVPAESLMTFLNGHRNVPVRISMRHQTRPDSRVVQALLTASRDWKGRNVGFDVSDLPPRLMQDFARLGLTNENTGWSAMK